MEKASEHRPHVCVPDVTMISDDDPDFLDEGRIDLKDPRSLDQGRMQDFEDSIDLLSIKIEDIGLVPFSNVRYDKFDSLEFPELKPKNVNSVSDLISANDPDVIRVQIDTGTCATVTGKKHILHFYREFGPDFPCPIRIKPATEGSDATPIGVGYMFVEAPNEEGFIPV